MMMFDVCKKFLFSLCILIFFSSLVSATLNDGLVSYWSFDEGSGTINKNNITSNFDNWTSVGNPMIVTGKLGNAKVMNGVNQYLSINNSIINYFNDTKIPNYTFTWNFWIRSNYTNCGDDIEEIYETYLTTNNNIFTNGITIFRNAYDNYFSETYFGQVKNNNNFYCTNYYNMFTIISNNTNVTRYFNGTLLDSFGVDTTNKQNTRWLTIGSQYGSYEFSTASIDEFGIWNRTLNITEIEQLYNNGSGLPYNFSTTQQVTCYICNETCSPCGSGCLVDDLSFMYDGVTNFDATYGDITGWNTSCIVDTSYMFRNSDFNQDISNWDLTNVYNINGMFRDNAYFNQDISSWDMPNLIFASDVFNNASSFDNEIALWNVPSIEYMNRMFANSNFNQNLFTSNIDTKYYSGLFSNSVYNQYFDISDDIIDASYMFSNNSVFNQDISLWNTFTIVDYSYMFENAINIQQDFSNWDFSEAENLDGMFKGVNLSINNYDALLHAMANTNDNYDNSSIIFDGGYSQYSVDGLDDRNYLINILNWTITDGGLYECVNFSINMLELITPIPNSIHYGYLYSIIKVNTTGQNCYNAYNLNYGVLGFTNYSHIGLTNMNVSYYSFNEINLSVGTYTIFANIEPYIYNSSNNVSLRKPLCYQESANVSNQTGIDGVCGLEYNGSYVSNIDNRNIYINYSKPDYALNTSIWRVKYSSNTSLSPVTTGLVNDLSIPESCWYANPNILELRLYSSRSGYSDVSSYCFDGNDWLQLEFHRRNGVLTCNNPSSFEIIFDGNWDTGVCGGWALSCSWNDNNDCTLANLYEEAMMWDVADIPCNNFSSDMIHILNPLNNSVYYDKDWFVGEIFVNTSGQNCYNSYNINYGLLGYANTSVYNLTLMNGTYYSFNFTNISYGSYTFFAEISFPYPEDTFNTFFSVNVALQESPIPPTDDEVVGKLNNALSNMIIILIIIGIILSLATGFLFHSNIIDDGLLVQVILFSLLGITLIILVLSFSML